MFPHRRALKPLLVLAFSAACSAGNEPAPAPTTTPAVATLTLAAPVTHLERWAREPMAVEHPSGTLFVSGYGESTPTLWQSHDRGTTWARVDVGTEAQGAMGNSDVDLAVARDGTLYFVTMVYDRKANEGVSISIGVSKDAGSNWVWTPLSTTRFDDRPWVDVAPDGTAHVIWNDGSGVSHAVSQDGGVTWTERAKIHPQGGSSHLAVGPNGEVAVRVTPLSASGNKFDEGVELVAVSTDAGVTWQKHAAPGQRKWMFPLDDDDPLPRWVEPVAWDARGDLYLLWSDPTGLWLARSRDHGQKWAKWRVVKSAETMFFPYLVGRGAGELAGTWFSGTSTNLQAHVARFALSDGDAAPRVVAAPPFRPDSWRRADAPAGGPRPGDPGGEYIPVLFLRDGGLAVVTPVQDIGAKRFGFSWWRVESPTK
jgi:hypothetical protein